MTREELMSGLHEALGRMHMNALMLADGDMEKARLTYGAMFQGYICTVCSLLEPDEIQTCLNWASQLMEASPMMK